MTTDIVIPVPPQVRSTFAVPLPALPADPGAVLDAALGRLPDAVARVAQRLIDAGALVVAERPAGDALPMTDDVLGVLGADPAQAALLRAVPTLLLVDAVGPPGDPGPLLAAAGVAAGLALELPAVELPVVDLAGVRLVRPQQLLDALPGTGLVVRLVQWVQVLHSGGPEGLWFTTKGLGRFGLPELQTEGVPTALAGGWGTVLNGLSSVLVRRWYELLHGTGGRADQAFVVLPAEVEVSSADVVRAHHGPPGDPVPLDCPVVAAVEARAAEPGAAPSRPRPGARVRLRFDPEPDLHADSFLGVIPPADHGGSAEAFFEATCAAVLVPPADAVRRVA